VFGWPRDTDDLRAFYPGNTLVTDADILFFWVARMIMMGYEFQGEAPFKEVYLHGTVRDAKGRRMSKSLGNGIDPMEVVRAYGADAMRYTIVSQCAVGTDISLDHEDLEGAFSSGRNFANKIWNAGRFALMSLGDASVASLEDVMGDLELEDRWILSRIQKVSAEATDNLERFRLHEVAEGLYHFFWGDLCDWYLELVKSRLAPGADAASREAARTTLVVALDRALRLLHPIVPFVTAELWARLPWPEGSDRPDDLIVAPWPVAEDDRVDEEAERVMAGLQELIVEVRRLRKEYGVPEGQRIGIHVTGGAESFLQVVRERSAAFEQLARVDRIATTPAASVGAHAVLANGAELFLPLEGVIDLDRERARLVDELGRVNGHVEATRKKLDNQAFVSRAPSEVVQKERDRVAQLEEQRTKLREKLASLEGATS
jgi:valyl-tRNA synthetase